MPTYVYECRRCGFNFEQLQSMSAEPLKVCPKCGGQVRRLIAGGAGLIVKGHAASNSACSLEQTGHTCCGRSTRCDSPACDT